MILVTWEMRNFSSSSSLSLATCITKNNFRAQFIILLECSDSVVLILPSSSRLHNKFSQTSVIFLLQSTNFQPWNFLLLNLLRNFKFVYKFCFYVSFKWKYWISLFLYQNVHTKFRESSKLVSTWRFA